MVIIAAINLPIVVVFIACTYTVLCIVS